MHVISAFHVHYQWSHAIALRETARETAEVIGREAGGGGSLMLRQLHEYSGFVFIPALVVTVLMWIREALPKAYDMNWLAHFSRPALPDARTPASGSSNPVLPISSWAMAAAR